MALKIIVIVVVVSSSIGTLASELVCGDGEYRDRLKCVRSLERSCQPNVAIEYLSIFSDSKGDRRFQSIRLSSVINKLSRYYQSDTVIRSRIDTLISETEQRIKVGSADVTDIREWLAWIDRVHTGDSRTTKLTMHDANQSPTFTLLVWKDLAAAERWSDLRSLLPILIDGVNSEVSMLEHDRSECSITIIQSEGAAENIGLLKSVAINLDLVEERTILEELDQRLKAVIKNC